MNAALFTYGNGIYWPANKNAAYISHVLSKRFLREEDMLTVKSKGYEPMLTNGQHIGKVDLTV